MTDKQRRIRMIIAWASIIVWGIFAIVLSRQDGSATAELSYGLSEHTAEFLGNIGINIHAELLNEIIRKIAHIVIYLVLGGYCIMRLHTHSDREQNSRLCCLSDSVSLHPR